MARSMAVMLRAAMMCRCSGRSCRMRRACGWRHTFHVHIGTRCHLHSAHGASCLRGGGGNAAARDSDRHQSTKRCTSECQISHAYLLLCNGCRGIRQPRPAAKRCMRVNSLFCLMRNTRRAEISLDKIEKSFSSLAMACVNRGRTRGHRAQLEVQPDPLATATKRDFSITDCDNCDRPGQLYMVTISHPFDSD